MMNSIEQRRTLLSMSLVIQPALLNARLLAAELAGAVNSVRANGR